MTNNPRPLSAVIAAIGIMLAVPAWPTPAMTLRHVHGLVFSEDGRTLMIPSHDGLALYRDGRWTKAPGPAHDYMGFTGSRQALYSSGHPAPGSELPNPFGLLRSRDGGKTWERLGLTGEADFHLMAASHETGAVYVFNAAPNSRMPAAGIYWTANQGMIWRRANAGDLEGRIFALAVHPKKPEIVAVGTDRGLFISRDHGNRFARSGVAAPVTAVAFDLAGERVWFGAFDKKAMLARLRIDGSPVAPLSLPPLGPRDAVTYIAQNPANRGQWAIATAARDVYLTTDGAKSWRQLAADGKTR